LTFIAYWIKGRIDDVLPSRKFVTLPRLDVCFDV